LDPSSIARGAATEQYVTFWLGNEIYGLKILRVKETRGWAPVTGIAQSPPNVLGVAECDQAA
jgi:purine-binding chemotaxis protein CheW